MQRKIKYIISLKKEQFFRRISKHPHNLHRKKKSNLNDNLILHPCSIQHHTEGIMYITYIYVGT